MKSKPILRRDFLKTSSLGALALSGLQRKAAATAVAEDVGSWVSKLRYEDLPPQTIQKFLGLSEKVLGKVRAQKAAEIILSIERTSNLKDLLGAVAG